MNDEEAKAILKDVLTRLRREPYAKLAGMVGTPKVTTEHRGASGTTYVVDVMAFWDDHRDEDVRVVAAIDDAGWRAFVPLTEDFIIASDGTFRGETR